MNGSTRVQLMGGRWHLMWLAALVVTGMYSPSADAQSVDLGSPPGVLVDIGGRRIHLNCVGAGSPTVILHTTTYRFSVDWSLVQPMIAERTRVCSYDLAGHGWSDSGDPFATLRMDVDDLSQVLLEAEEPGPFVHVGVGPGATSARLFHARHVEQAAGLVLIAPGGELRIGEGKLRISDHTPQFIANVPAAAMRYKPLEKLGPPYGFLPRAVAEMRPRLIAAYNAGQPDLAYSENMRQTAQGNYYTWTTLREIDERGAGSLGDLPILVVSPNDVVGDDLAVQIAISSLSTVGRHENASVASGEIHVFAPQVVVDAVVSVLPPP